MYQHAPAPGLRGGVLGIQCLQAAAAAPVVCGCQCLAVGHTDQNRQNNCPAGQEKYLGVAACVTSHNRPSCVVITVCAVGAVSL